LPPLHCGRLNNRCIFSQFLGYFIQHFNTLALGIYYFPSSEAQSDFYLVLVGQELLYVLDLEIQVVFFCFWSEFYFLDLDDRLAFSRFCQFLALFIAIFVIIHDPADRGIRCIGDLNQVKSFLVCHFAGTPAGHYTELLAIRADQADLLIANIFIQPDLQFPLGYRWLAFLFNTIPPCVIS
jgi:hypothetical protein